MYAFFFFQLLALSGSLIGGQAAPCGDNTGSSCDLDDSASLMQMLKLTKKTVAGQSAFERQSLVASLKGYPKGSWKKGKGKGTGAAGKGSPQRASPVQVGMRRHTTLKKGTANFETKYWNSAYVVDVTVNGQTFPVQIDTGSSDFAVLATPVRYPNGTDMGCPYFKGAEEHCLLDQNLTFSGGYVTGSWKGVACGSKITFGKDSSEKLRELASKMVPVTTSLAGFTATIPFVGILTEDEFIHSCGNVGIIGMAYKDESDILDTTFWEFLYAENKETMQNVFSIGACPYNGPALSLDNADEQLLDTDAGVLTLGGSDPNYYTGELQWTPITHESLYCVELLKFGLLFPNGTAVSIDVNQSTAHNYGNQANCSAVVDSGNDSGFMLSPQLFAFVGRYLAVLAEEMCPRIMGRACTDRELLMTERYCAPENLFESYYPNFVFEFGGGLVLKVPPERYYGVKVGPWCAKSPYGSFSSSGRRLQLTEYENTNLGQSFLETYYTVFDRGNKRLGFAPLAGCN